MQYKTGTVNVEFDNNIVTGNDTQWLSNVSIGDLFSVKGSRVLYEITSVNDDTSITLVSNYRGGDKTADYIIHRDFIDNVPLLSNKDNNTGTILTNMARRFQERFMYSDLDYKGEWQAGTYNEKDVVLKNKKLYSAIVETSTQPPSSDWRLLYDGIEFIYSDNVEKLGQANSGNNTAPARNDHIHKMPTVGEIGVVADTSTTEDLPESGDSRYYTLEREDKIIQLLLATHFS